MIMRGFILSWIRFKNSTEKSSVMRYYIRAFDGKKLRTYLNSAIEIIFFEITYN